MDLVEVDVVGAEAAERAVDRRHDVLARQPAVVGSSLIGIEDLGGDDDDCRACAKSFSARPRTSSRRAERVHVGGVEEVDAEFEGAFDERTRLALRRGPTAATSDAAVGHRAETDARDLEPRPSERHVLHQSILSPPAALKGCATDAAVTWLRYISHMAECLKSRCLRSDAFSTSTWTPSTRPSSSVTIRRCAASRWRWAAVQEDAALSRRRVMRRGSSAFDRQSRCRARSGSVPDC